MMKRVIILGLIACSLLVASVGLVSAADETKTLDDEIGDVVDLIDDSIHPEIEDIDITQIIYTKSGRDVTVEIYVKDEIEQSTATYIIAIVTLSTSQHGYTIYSIDDLVIAQTDEGEEIDSELSGFGTKILTFTFDLIAEDEEYVEMAVALSKEDEEGTYSYYDMIPNEELGSLDVDAGGPYEGKAGESISFSGTVKNGTSPYEWEWDFGDGEISDEQNPSHVFDEEGTYSVFLMVMDNDNNYGFSTTTVEISGSANGSNGNGDDSSDGGSGLTMFIALIVIIVVAGVAVVVYFIRR
jgi:hypothetical protein